MSVHAPEPFHKVAKKLIDKIKIPSGDSSLESSGGKKAQKVVERFKDGLARSLKFRKN